MSIEERNAKLPVAAQLANALSQCERSSQDKWGAGV